MDWAPCMPPMVSAIIHQGWVVTINGVKIYISQNGVFWMLKSYLSELNCYIVTQYVIDEHQDLCFDRFTRVHMTVRELRSLDIIKNDNETYSPDHIVIFSNSHYCEYIHFHTSHKTQFVQHWMKASDMIRPERKKHTTDFEEFVRDMTPKK